MTTESHRRQMSPGSLILARSSVGLFAGALVVVAVALVAGGADAAGSALTGGVVSALVLAFGSWVVHVVASAMPSASMLVALLTYALQIALLTAFMALLAGSEEWGASIRPGWVVASVIACVMVWAALQVVFTTRARIPAYDLSSRDQEAGR